MEIADLEKFLLIAQTNSLQKAAITLNVTPSALSKSLKRLEASLQVSLFDRVGKSLRLNQHGEQLQPKARELVELAHQTKRALNRSSTALICRIAAPAILQYRWLSPISRCLRQQLAASTLEVDTLFEQQALQRLKQGDVHLALVTGTQLKSLPDHIMSQPLGSLTMQTAISRNHPLAQALRDRRSNKGISRAANAEEVLKYPFATPHISPFCGEARGQGCDGWNEQLFPRQIGWVVNDYAVIGQLVRSGQAVAYLPDFLLREWQLQQVQVTNCPYTCNEQIYLLYHQRAASWVHQLIEHLCR
ncbi:LysR family transcriptional regulator [Corallincola holothuriorum]|uniref:LysR family transcriptional regulator n=1 Tax=Corallincola holothuriorum TaxID=2282215 RepID=A0A368NF32_9GAMM|nr:LysR family transcriptional regulator [Corallincola holothuriorum]RCU49257.1 LysR family transcriptional regulator [Corallincola holothuriorum]